MSTTAHGLITRYFAADAKRDTDALVALVTDDYLRRERYDGPEVYALYLVAAVTFRAPLAGERT